MTTVAAATAAMLIEPVVVMAMAVRFGSAERGRSVGASGWPPERAGTLPTGVVNGGDGRLTVTGRCVPSISRGMSGSSRR
jgi:hypothetical protein